METRTKRLVLAAIAAVLGVTMGASLVSCTPSADNDNSGQSGAIDQDTYAMNVVVSGVPFWEDAKSVWTAIDASEPDVTLRYGGPLDTNAQTQIEQIEALRASDLDGLVVAPADSAALVPVINELAAESVPVVTLLVDAPDSDRIAYVTSELKETSARIANTVLDANADGQKAIIVFAEAGNQEQETRAAGFREYLQDRGVVVVGEVTDNYSEAKSAEDIKAILTRDPDVKYIFGCHSRAAVGSVTAVREQGIEMGEIKITGWDTDSDVLSLIQDGWVEATAAQNSAYMVQIAFQILEAHTGNFVYPENRNFETSGVRVIPEVISVPATIVTETNALAYFPN